MSSYSPPRRLKQQVVLGLTPRLGGFQFVNFFFKPCKPAERNSPRGQVPEPRLLTIPGCTFRSGKQEREPGGSSLGPNSWREREPASAASALAGRRRVRTPGRQAAREPSCVRRGARGALGVCSPSSSLFPPPSARCPPPPRPFPHSSKVVSRLLPSLKLTKPDFYSQPRQLPVNRP